MSLFERWLTLWVALCIVAGVALGHVVPGFFHAVIEVPVMLTVVWMVNRSKHWVRARAAGTADRRSGAVMDMGDRHA
jgi:ACR3 family arsenite efflux pump ArsB